MVGVKPITINRIENGSLDLSPDLAAKIHVSTGISIDELAKGSKGRLLDQIGRPYSGETFSRWRTRSVRASEDDAVRVAKNLEWWLEILLRAAAKSREGHAYQAVIATLLQVFNQVRHDFDLVTITNAILKESEPRIEWRPGGPTPGDLLAIQKEYEIEIRKAEPSPWWGGVRWSLPKQKSKRLSTKKRRR
jgi:hypothetical protein